MRVFVSICIIWCVLLLGAGPGMAQENASELKLTLEDCILLAMEKNLDIAIEVLEKESADASVKNSKEKFLPEFTFTFNKRDTESASYSWLDAAGEVKTQYNDYVAEISQFLPTGGNVSVSLNIDKNDTNRNFQTINPRFGSTLRFNLTQPLLKDFGFKMSRRDITAAKNNREMTKSRFKDLVLTTIYNVESAYWNLVYSIENLKAQQQSLQLARDLLAKNKRSVEIGTLAPIEIRSAQAEVATREAEILEGQALIENNMDELKNILNLAKEDMAKTIVPLDKPAFEQKEIKMEEAVDLAFKHRPDLNERKFDIANKKLDLDYAKNQMLPDLSLQLTYWSPGVSGTQLIYLDNNPLTGVIIGTIPGGSSDAVKDALRLLYPNWQINLALSVPLSTIISRAQVAQSRIGLKQSNLRLENTIKQVMLEIKTALRNVQTNYKRVLAYRLARELNEKKLETEIQKLNVGQSTNYNVLQFQRDLASSRSTELKALIDYNLSLANQQKVLGITCEEKNIKLK